MSNSENEQEVNIDPFENIEETAQTLSTEIANLLKAEVEELSIFSHVFRTALERSVKRVLWASKKNPKPISIYPETIPGFTLMLFRKLDKEKESENAVALEREDKTKEVVQSPFKNKENEALKGIMNKFFEKNKQQVMMIEYTDTIFALFPLANTRENLKKMEMYFSE